MAAAVMARRLSSCLAASARSTPTGLPSAPTIRVTTRPFSTPRPHSSTDQPDPTKMREVAENLVSVLKETPSEATRSKAESLVNQLKGFYPAPVEENTPKLIKMVEDLMKTLKKPQSEELTLDRIRLQNVQDQLSELKAHTKLTSAVIFSILGVFGCLLISLPNGVLKVEMMSENSQRSSSERQDRLENKHSKLKSRVESLEAAKNMEAVEVDEDIIAVPVPPVESWFRRFVGLVKP